MKAAAVTLALIAGALCTAQAGTAPIPLEVPATWQLDVEVQPPKPIKVRLPGETKARTYWYVLYSVMNRYRDPITKRPTEQLYVPDFSLFTDTGQLLRAGRKVPGVVFQAIKKRHQNPHLKDMVSITGKLLYGEDNAKDGVAIWRDFDNKAGKIDIFIGGLSGEIVDVKLPAKVKVIKADRDGKPVVKEIDTLRMTKTLQLTYRVVAEPAAREFGKVKLLAKKWVMR